VARSQETYNKKEKTKKRLQKRKEKEQRRDEKRQESGKTKSLEDMIAYVDENGNISSTPPDPKKAKPIALEDIPIVTPKAESGDASDAVPTGTVTYFDESRGFGFITDSRTQERIFFHVNDLSEPLAVGDNVEYTAKKGPRGLQAETVRKGGN